MKTCADFINKYKHKRWGAQRSYVIHSPSLVYLEGGRAVGVAASMRFVGVHVLVSDKAALAAKVGLRAKQKIYQGQ